MVIVAFQPGETCSKLYSTRPVRLRANPPHTGIKMGHLRLGEIQESLKQEVAKILVE